MQSPKSVFESFIVENVLIIAPFADIRELDYEQIDEGSQRITDLRDQHGLIHIVVDFRNTDFCGSTALGFFIKLGRQVADENGKMALCCVGEHPREVLAATKLDDVWPIFESREEAVQFVRDSA